MPDPKLLERAQDAIAIAKAAGAQHAYAWTSRNREVEFTGRDGELEKVQENTSRSLGIKLYVDGRYSSHTTTSLAPERLKSFITEAVALTRALEPDEHRALPDPSLYPTQSVDLGIVDAGVDARTSEDRQAWLTAMDGVARADDRVISATGYVSDSHGEGASASSNGFAGDWESTSAWVGCSVTVRDEGDSRPEGGMWIGGRKLGQLYSVEQVAKEALQRATDRLGSAKGPTKKSTMVVDPTAGGSLIGRLLGPASARSIAQGRSCYADKKGHPLFSRALTIIDNPLIPGALGSREFDSEGIASKALPIVIGGTLTNFYVDTYYGRKAGLAVTTGDRSNVIVQPGVSKGLTELIADVSDGIYVTSWLGGNADSTTGDFSFGLRGHLIEGGQIGAPVGEMNVTGNLVELFKQLAVVGNDPWPYRSTQVPTMVFEDVQFSGV